MYQVCWADLNDHSPVSGLYSITIFTNRIVYAYALYTFRNDGCVTSEYLAMTAAAVRLYIYYSYYPFHVVIDFDIDA